MATVWCDLGFFRVPNSRGNKVAANLRPTSARLVILLPEPRASEPERPAQAQGPGLPASALQGPDCRTACFTRV